MSLVPHPTDPDKMVFKALRVPAMFRARTVTEALYDLAERLEHEEDKGTQDAWSRLLAQAPKRHEPCEMGPMCVTCNPPTKKEAKC